MNEEKPDADASDNFLQDEQTEEDLFSTDGLRATLLAALRHDRFPIPALPDTLVQLNAQIQTSEWDIRASCAIIERDATLAGRVLARASAASYGAVAPTALPQALMRLGALGLRDLTFALMLGRLFPAGGLFAAWMEQEHLRAFPQALACQRIFERLGLDRSLGFLGGLLADVGRLAILAVLSKDVSAKRHVNVIPPLLDYLHTEVGEAILKRWEVAPDLVEITRAHHHLAMASPDLADTVQAAALAIAIFEAIEANSVPEGIIATLRGDHTTPLIASLDDSILGLMVDDVAEVAVETLS